MFAHAKSVRYWAALALMLAMLAWVTGPGGYTTPVRAAAGEVLILDSTVTGGAGSLEAQAAVAAGKTPVIVNAAQWSAMTTDDFAQYDAIVLGDPTCSVDTSQIAAAEANALIWGAAVDGNVIIIGSDPVYHSNLSGAVELINKGMAFAVDEPGKTGAYITLSCYYHFDAAGTPVPLLDGISGGGFSVVGAAFIPGLNDVRIVATHPALDGLTNADLSNWGNSVHAGFETWPLELEVLAIAHDAGGPFTAPDGTVGYPYILARGVEIISDITLSPDHAVNPVGTSHTVTATVVTDDPEPDTPVVGTTITFTVIDGPHTGHSDTDVTGADGKATFTYTGTDIGIDTIEATFVDALGRTQRSNRVTKEWVEGDREIDVHVDIRPTSCPNPLNVRQGGVLPVAILGTADFDVSEIDPESVTLEGVSALSWDIEDVAAPFTDGLSDPPELMDCTTAGPDGHEDLTLKFDAKALIAAIGDVEDGDVVVLQLTGELHDGTPITGQDIVWIISRGR